MKNERKANETTCDLGLEVFGVAHQGRLTAYLFEKNGRYRVLIVSEDFPQGEPVPRVEASDIEDLTKLTAGIAGVLHNHAQLEPGLIDDLGCLAHTLSNALGVQFQENYIPIGEVQ